jgi:hypothetical protein
MGPTIVFGPRLQLPAAPYGQTQVPRSVCASSNLKTDLEAQGLVRISYALCPDQSPIFYDRRAQERARCIENLYHFYLV